MEADSKDVQVLELLGRWQAGDRAALAELTPIVYRELHRLARHYMRRERRGHTLQATALVNEAFMRLGKAPQVLTDRAHFYGMAARLMRRILLDHAKAHGRLKRSGAVVPLELSDKIEEMASFGGIDVVEVDDALRQLELHDSETARAFELHYFGGLTIEETAAALAVSASTVVRSIRLARAWLVKSIAGHRRSH